MSIKRISKETLKENGFYQVDSMQCYTNNHVVVSYGLVVAIGITTADGYHDYSPTTAKQVTRATGVNTADRRKNWNIISEDDFIKKVKDWKKANNL